MQKIVFSSEDLPSGLDDHARFSLWRDLYTAQYGSLDLSRPDDRPFSVQCELARFSGVALARFEGTVNRAARTPHEIAADATDSFCLLLNRGRTRMAWFHRAREGPLDPGGATLLDSTETGGLRGEASNGWFGLVLPRAELLARVAHAEDTTAVTLDPGGLSLRHLRSYCDILLGPDGVGDDPALTDHIGTTLVDLVAICLGATREGAEIARMRGLRAARLQLILASIRAGSADPAFSPQDAGRELGVSPRYVRDLLQETGLSFTARVLELRLQRARAMLSAPRHDRLKVADIAHACGFSEIPYFNRCFRRRFGASPTEFRSRSG